VFSAFIPEIESTGDLGFRIRSRKVRAFLAFILVQDSGVLGLHPLAEFGRSRLCLRLTQGSGVLGSASTPHKKDSTPLQKPRITARGRLNARPNPRASHGPPQASGQPIRAVTTSDVTAPRARQQP